MSSPITIQDALIYVMVTMSAVDRTMTDAELAQIGKCHAHPAHFPGFQ